MTLPLFLAEPGELKDLVPGAEFVLDGPEGRHAATVKRLNPGRLCGSATAPVTG